MERKPIDWKSMSDSDFLQCAEQQIWLSAFASNNPRAPAHGEADRALAEARRRGKPWLYQQAWNAAYRSCGYQPSESDVKNASEAQP